MDGNLGAESVASDSFRVSEAIAVGDQSHIQSHAYLDIPTADSRKLKKGWLSLDFGYVGRVWSQVRCSIRPLKLESLHCVHTLVPYGPVASRKITLNTALHR